MGGITCSYDSETQVITFNGTCNTDNTLFKFIGTSFTPIVNTSTLSVHYVSGSVTNYCRIRFFTSTFGGNINFDIDSLSDSTPIIAVTSTENTELTENSIRFNNGSVANNFKIKVMFANSTNTTYEEYYNYELCKIGNYQDYLYKSNDKWYKKENIYKIANKTNWVVSSMGTNNRAVISLNGNGFPYSSDIGYAIANAVSNNLIGISQLNQATTTEINNVAINNSNMYIKFADTINTTALVKTQLDSMTSLEVYYVVATPQDIEITNTTLIEQLNNLEKAQSYNGITNISSNGNLPIVLGVSAIKGE